MNTNKPINELKSQVTEIDFLCRRANALSQLALRCFDRIELHEELRLVIPFEVVKTHDKISREIDQHHKALNRILNSLEAINTKLSTILN